MALEEQEICKYRRQIDELDTKIANYLNKRAEIVLAIKNLKQKAKLPVFDPQREQEILTRLALNNKGPLSSEDLKEIYRHVLYYMRNFE